MCPDDPVLSSFHDHELPPGSSERIEAHVAGCEHCRTRLRRFQSVSHRLLECEEPDVEEAAIRVWRRLDAQAPAASARRRGSLRLPIAAASAALAVAFVFTLALGDRPPALDEWGRAALSRMAAVPDEPVVPYAGPERAAVLELTLPSTSEFRLFGAPKILHEIELQPAAAASLGDPATLEVSLPPARFQLVGSPVIVHEGEMLERERETAKP